MDIQTPNLNCLARSFNKKAGMIESTRIEVKQNQFGTCLWNAVLYFDDDLQHTGPSSAKTCGSKLSFLKMAFTHRVVRRCG